MRPCGVDSFFFFSELFTHIYFWQSPAHTEIYFITAVFELIDCLFMKLSFSVTIISLSLVDIGAFCEIFLVKKKDLIFNILCF